MAVLTLAQYKALTGISSGDTSNDTQLSAIITATQALVERTLGLKFETTTLTEWYSVPFGARSIQLRTYPVQSITSVQAYYSPTEYADIASSYYRIDTDTGILIFVGGDPLWWWGATTYQYSGVPNDYPRSIQDGILNYKIVYVGGSASASTDTALQLAMSQAVDLFYAMAGQDPRIKSENIMSYAYQMGTAGDKTIAENIKTIFNAYMNGGNL